MERKDSKNLSCHVCFLNFTHGYITDVFVGFPYGKVPYLEIDDLFLHQSMAMCRYLAQKHGLTGKNATDAIEADIMADTVNDIRGGEVHTRIHVIILINYYFIQDWQATFGSKMRL